AVPVKAAAEALVRCNGRAGKPRPNQNIRSRMKGPMHRGETLQLPIERPSGRAPFSLALPWDLAGDQPTAAAGLIEGLSAGDRHITLRGVTGSGKTVTMAKVIAEAGRPALVLAHNKTLAAQLYGEFTELFPGSPVQHF